jgi:tripartite-type tricarboxylate transporter receptor subunit TctC
MLIARQSAWAQAYPSRPVRIVVGVAPGGATDTSARLVGQWLSGRLNQSFVIENRPGAGGNIATEYVAKSPSDGYTLLVIAPSHAIDATLYPNLNFNFMRDIAPVAGIVRQGYIMVVNPTVPAKTVSEFISYARANPGKINYGSAGTGTMPHLAGELFKMMAGVDLVHIPYRGGASALPDLIGGQLQVMFLTPTMTLEYIKAGKLRGLATTVATHSEGLPDIPMLADFVPGYEVSTWFGIGAPKNTPAEVIAKLNMEINAALVDPKIRAQLADLGGTPLTGSAADFAKLIADETERWASVVKFARIKPE